MSNIGHWLVWVRTEGQNIKCSKFWMYMVLCLFWSFSAVHKESIQLLIHWNILSGWSLHMFCNGWSNSVVQMLLTWHDLIMNQIFSLSKFGMVIDFLPASVNDSLYSRIIPQHNPPKDSWRWKHPIWVCTLDRRKWCTAILRFEPKNLQTKCFHCPSPLFHSFPWVWCGDAFCTFHQN